jgi:hypothetical protein
VSRLCTGREPASCDHVPRRIPMLRSLDSVSGPQRRAGGAGAIGPKLDGAAARRARKVVDPGRPITWAADREGRGMRAPSLSSEGTSGWRRWSQSAPFALSQIAPTRRCRSDRTRRSRNSRSAVFLITPDAEIAGFVGDGRLPGVWTQDHVLEAMTAAAPAQLIFLFVPPQAAHMPARTRGSGAGG